MGLNATGLRLWSSAQLPSGHVHLYAESPAAQPDIRLPGLVSEAGGKVEASGGGGR